MLRNGPYGAADPNPQSAVACSQIHDSTFDWWVVAECMSCCLLLNGFRRVLREDAQPKHTRAQAKHTTSTT